MKELSPLVRWWVTPKLPREHIFIPPEKRPDGFSEILRIYSRKWLIHPIKRRVAKYYLKVLQKFFGLTVIGITGSCGKTTVKEMMRSILKQKGQTVASHKNIDPIFNIPTSILKCKQSTKFLILEMGVEFPGEMDFYLWLARPSVGVVTNVYPTHTEFFENEEGVAKEKVKLVKALPKDGYAILNRDNSFTNKFVKKTKARVILYGEKGNVKSGNISFSSNFRSIFTLHINKKKIIVKLPVLGKQFVSNALAAASVGHALGFTPREIKNGLQSYSNPAHRMNVLRLKSGALLLDDSYNNNPAAAKEALNTFKKVAGSRKKILVFGDMLELGVHKNRHHRQIGKYISSIGLEHFVGVGSAAKITSSEVRKTIKNTVWVANEKQVDKKLKPYLNRNSVVLIKGSRSIKLDRLASRLLV